MCPLREASTKRMCMREPRLAWRSEIYNLKETSYRVTVASGMSSYVKLTAFSIKTIFRSLTLFVLQILTVY